MMRAKHHMRKSSYVGESCKASEYSMKRCWAMPATKKKKTRIPRSQCGCYRGQGEPRSTYQRRNNPMPENKMNVRMNRSWPESRSGDDDRKGDEKHHWYWIPWMWPAKQHFRELRIECQSAFSPDWGYVIRQHVWSPVGRSGWEEFDLIDFSWVFIFLRIDFVTQPTFVSVRGESNFGC